MILDRLRQFPCHGQRIFFTRPPAFDIIGIRRIKCCETEQALDLVMLHPVKPLPDGGDLFPVLRQRHAQGGIINNEIER